MKILYSLLFIIFISSCNKSIEVSDKQNEDKIEESNINIDSLLRINEQNYLFLRYWYSMSSKNFKATTNWEIQHNNIDSMMVYTFQIKQKSDFIKYKAKIEPIFNSSDSLDVINLNFYCDKTNCGSGNDVSIFNGSEDLIKLYTHKYGKPVFRNDTINNERIEKFIWVLPLKVIELSKRMYDCYNWEHSSSKTQKKKFKTENGIEIIDLDEKLDVHSYKKNEIVNNFKIRYMTKSYFNKTNNLINKTRNKEDEPKKINTTLKDI